MATESNSSNEEPRGWYTRGYLPRFDAGENRTQFITCRLYDSLPQKVLARFKEELRLRNIEHIEREKLILIEKYVDAGYGHCFLKERPVATIIQDALKRYDGERYRLYAWVVMPNHIHVLLRQVSGFKLEKIIHSLKSFTAQESNKVLGREGKFWMREAFDRYIRDEEHFGRALRYIENNPVKAKLCVRPEDWEFSSAWDRWHSAGHTSTGQQD